MSRILYPAPAPANIQQMKADPIPEHTQHNTAFWFGLHTTGNLAGKWRRFPHSTTAAPVSQTVAGEQFIFGYEHDRTENGRRTWVVKYRRELISILCTVSTQWSADEQKSLLVALPQGDYFWLTEVSREHWEGVL